VLNVYANLFLVPHPRHGSHVVDEDNALRKSRNLIEQSKTFRSRKCVNTCASPKGKTCDPSEHTLAEQDGTQLSLTFDHLREGGP
jgi:hypothetical protein